MDTPGSSERVERVYRQGCSRCCFPPDAQARSENRAEGMTSVQDTTRIRVRIQPNYTAKA